MFHLVDDWGWANAGWHANPQNEKEVHTPRMDALVKEGIELCVEPAASLRLLARHRFSFSLHRTRGAPQGPRLFVSILLTDSLVTTIWSLSIARE